MAPKANGRGVQVEDTRICVVMVGLPARGKSYIAQKGNYRSALCVLSCRILSCPILSLLYLYWPCH